MNFGTIDERLRTCSTLLQALQAVKSLSLPAGRVHVRSGQTSGVVDFQGSRITAASVTETHETGAAALDILVSLQDARCLYLAPDAWPEGEEKPKPPVPTAAQLAAKLKAFPAPLPAMAGAKKSETAYEIVWELDPNEKKQAEQPEQTDNGDQAAKAEPAESPSLSEEIENKGDQDDDLQHADPTLQQTDFQPPETAQDKADFDMPTPPEEVDPHEETMEIDPGVIAASPLSTGVRSSLMREQLRRAMEGDGIEDIRQRHKEEFLQVSGKMAEYTGSGAQSLGSTDANWQLPPAERGGIPSIVRIGFTFDETKEKPSVENALLSCHTLVDALLTVTSLGIKEGILELDSEKMKGSVEFKNKKIVKATIAESDETSEEAVRTLMALADVSCKYSPFPERPIAKGLSESLGRIMPRASWDPRTMKFLSMDAPPAKPASPPKPPRELLPHQRQTNEASEEDFEQIAERHRAEFESSEGLLADKPVRRDTHFVPKKVADETDDYDPTALTLARAGFAWDFRDVDVRPSFTSVWATSAVGKMAEVKISRASKSIRKYVLPAVIVWLCLAIYTIPTLLWQSSATKDPGQAEDMKSLAYHTYDAMDDGNALRRSKYQPASVGSGPTISTPTVASGDQIYDELMKLGREDPSDAAEFALAENPATLTRLEELIHRYLSLGNYRRARDLALCAIRSPYANDEMRSRMFEIYKMCLKHQK